MSQPVSPLEAEVRAIAEDEAHAAVASLAGLVLRRLQEASPGAATVSDLSSIFGEALEQFTTGPALGPPVEVVEDMAGGQHAVSPPARGEV